MIFLELNHPGIKIDLVKMDIQGYDFFGFMGMRTTLKRSINMILFGEFWPYGLEKSGIRPETYLKELENSGLHVTFIPEKKPSEIIAQTGNSKFYTDFVAVKKKEPSSK
jgi:hypothetical protein